MERTNLFDANLPEKTTPSSFLSPSETIQNEPNLDKKRKKNSFKEKTNVCIHSARKRKQIKCVNCFMENKARLRSCNVCKAHRCKECIKKEAEVKTTKKLRDPMLYICRSCLTCQSKERVRPSPSLAIQSRGNSGATDCVSCNPSDFANGKEITPPRNDNNLVGQHGKCPSCKYVKDNVLIIKTFFELLEQAANVNELDANSVLLMKNELFSNFSQTVNINCYEDFLLQPVLTICDDCLKNCLMNEKSFKSIFNKSMLGVKNAGEMSCFEGFNCIYSRERELINQLKTFVNRFSEECKGYQMLFEETLNQLMQGQKGMIETNDDSSKESTLILDSLNRKSMQLVQELKGTIENLTQSSNQLTPPMQYPFYNYYQSYPSPFFQYPYQSLVQNPYQPQYQYQTQHPLTPSSYPFFPMSSLNNSFTHQ